MRHRRVTSALALITLAVMLIPPAFFNGLWVGAALLTIPLVAAVVIALRPRLK